MRVSVVIAAYNAEKYLRACLRSVISQTLCPIEILVMDDGSTDRTVDILTEFRSKITILRRPHRGVVPVRNELVTLASGDYIAFLDSDDIWHPCYLERQCQALLDAPGAVAAFTWHLTFKGAGDYIWPGDWKIGAAPEIISPLDFLQQYTETTGRFGSMSFCVVPKATFDQLGTEPFCHSPTDDCFFCMQLPMIGSVVFTADPIVAYRITPHSLSSNRIRNAESWLKVFEALSVRYESLGDRFLRNKFVRAFAAQIRSHARLLMGIGATTEARREFLRSAVMCLRSPESCVKSMLLFSATFFPSVIQPPWPAADREAESAARTAVTVD